MLLIKRLFTLFVCFLSFSNILFAQNENETCFECHGDRTLTGEINNKEVSVWVNEKVFSNSIHSDLECISCHADIDPEDLPHADELAKVECQTCHDDAYDHYESSLHGVALAKGKKLAPTCMTCHGKHDILSSKNEKAKTYVTNIPELCGSCHKDGTPVSQLNTVSQSHILSNYTQSIHGDGLFRRGLIVTAVCTSCHSSHDILPHENPNSTINRNNIAKTCRQCHTQIEKVHLKVINGELWEKRPHEIPVCIDCHQPHVVRRVFYEESFSNEKCMKCHSNPNLSKSVNGEKVSLFVDLNEHQNSAHANNTCIKCHTNISNARNPVCLNSGKVDCSICHAENVSDYNISEHGILHAANDINAPYCTDCHGKHDVKRKDDITSSTFRRNIPELCGECHKDGHVAAIRYKGTQTSIVENYKMSIHGKGLLESGLMVTATCVDCHTSHKELPKDNPESSINKDNIAQTCANCHLGIYEEFKKSVHSPLVTKTDKKLPVCNDCHLSHTIERTDLNDFRQQILNQCGKCHEEITSTYFDTFHGKVSKLGSSKTAKCYDCHGAHNILPPTNPESKLSRENIVETCKTCHPNSNRKFVGYLSHATHHDSDKYPYLYYTFWFMTILLVSTFTFFGLHTLLWLPRGLAEKRKKRKESEAKKENGNE